MRRSRAVRSERGRRRALVLRHHAYRLVAKGRKADFFSALFSDEPAKKKKKKKKRGQT